MKKKLGLLKKKFELAAIAVTYAEAGEWGVASDYITKIEALNRSQNGKMLVVALDSEFSEETVEYTVNLADRMKYDLLAINAVTSQNLNLYLNKNRTAELKANLNKVFSLLVEKAKANRIRCETIITLKDIRSQIKQLLKQIRQVEFVLVQVDPGQTFSLNLEVPVFQIEAGKV